MFAEYVDLFCYKYSNFCIYIPKIFISVLALIKRSPFEFATALLLFLTLIIQIKNERKALKIKPIWKDRGGKPMLVLLVSNVGGRDIYPEFYGFKKWNGEIFEKKFPRVHLFQKFEPDHPRQELPFYSDVSGEPEELNKEHIDYFYVRTSNDDVFKKHIGMPLIRNIIRAYYRIMKHLNF